MLITFVLYQNTDHNYLPNCLVGNMTLCRWEGIVLVTFLHICAEESKKFFVLMKVNGGVKMSNYTWLPNIDSFSSSLSLIPEHPLLRLTTKKIAFNKPFMVGVAKDDGAVHLSGKIHSLHIK